MPVLSCEHLSKSFTRSIGGSNHFQDHVLLRTLKRTSWSVTAVDGVSLSLERGEWLGLYGPNGCGKTTLLRILGGLLPQDCGTVKQHGTISCFFTIGVGFHEEKAAEENLLMHGLLHGLTARDVRKQTDAIIEFAGVESHRKLPLKYYSTGMLAKLAFAATVFTDSDVYLFDEAMAVGDQEFRERCVREFQNLKKRGKAAILVDHYFSSLEYTCDRIVTMEAGCIVREDVPAGVR